MSLLLVLLAVYTCCAQGGSGQRNLRPLSAAMDAFAGDRALKSASFGLCVFSVDSHEVIFQYNADKTLVPASTLKISVTGAALAILGNDFRFETVLEYDGAIDSAGILNGNLYIRGGGDPSFGSYRFDSLSHYRAVFTRWIAAIQQAGIKKVEGNIIGDAGIFDDVLIPDSWSWGDIGNYYGAGTSGLSFHENLFQLIFKPAARIGQPARLLRTEPVLPGVSIVNRVKTGAANSGDQAFVFGGPYAKQKLIEGTIPYRNDVFTVRGASPDPPLLCAYTFYNMLVSAGVTVKDSFTTSRALLLANLFSTRKREVIAVHQSPMLCEIVNEVNKKSINAYTESLLKYLGYNRYKNGSFHSGIQAVTEYWRSKGIDGEGWMMKDGSGLSRMNGMTPRQQCAMVVAMRNESAFDCFYGSLPEAGRSGSIRDNYKGTPAEANLRAKSGSMKQIKSFAGYVRTKSGELLSFSVIVNHYACSADVIRSKLEILLGSLALIE